MWTIQQVRRRAPRLLLTLTVFMALSLSILPPLVSAEDPESYSAERIHKWLVDAITDTKITVKSPSVVELTPASHLMKVTNLSFELRGVTIGVDQVRVTCDGTSTVDIVVQLDILDKLPRFSCTVQLEYIDGVNKLQVADISNIVIAGTFTPSLSPGDINTIVDVMNQLLDESGLSVSSPGGNLQGIDVVSENSTSYLKAFWTGGSTSYQTASELEDKIGGMVTTLAGKATDYLAAGEGRWTVEVNVVSDTSLDIDAVFTALGVTTSLDASVTFDTLTATITNATLSVGSKSVTFSAAGEIGCSAGDPSIAMTSLTIGDEYPGFRDFIEHVDINAALLAAINQAVDDIVADPGLIWWPFCPTSIAVVGTNVVLYGGEEPYLIVGDVNLDGRTNIIDAMFIAQYTVQLRTLNADQLRCADTTADGAVNITDAMHIAQFTVDPDGRGGVLFKPLFDPVFHQGMIDPLTLT